MKYLSVSLAVLMTAVLATPTQGQDNPGWLHPAGPTPAQVSAAAEGSGSPPSPTNNTPLAAQSLPFAEMQSLSGDAPVPTPGGNEADEITPEIEALARGLGYDAVKAFEYVRNHIEYEPYYGSKKGAHLTLLEGSGNDFDQSSLLVALLRASGYSPSYKQAPCAFSYSYLQQWVGLMDNPFPQFTDAQFMAYYNQATATVLTRKRLAATEFFLRNGHFNAQSLEFEGDAYVFIPHVWVELTVSGTLRRLSPSLKTHDEFQGINLASATGYSRTQVLADAGGTVSSSPDSATGLQYANISARLDGYSMALRSYLRNQESSRSADRITGSREIQQVSFQNFSEVPQLAVWDDSPWLAVQTWQEIPESEMSKLQVKCGVFNYTAGNPGFTQVFYDETITMPSLRGRKLSLSFAGNTATIRLDEDTIWNEEQTIESVFTVAGTSVDIQIKASHNHFYRFWNGSAYIDSEQGRNDQSDTKVYHKNNGYSYVFAYAFGNPEKLSRGRQVILDGYRRSGLTETDWRMRTEVLNIMGLQWLQQTWQLNRASAPLFSTLPSIYHRFGRVAQEQSYYIDFDLQSGAPAHRRMNFSVASDFLGFTNFAWSAMEHGVIEQMQGEGKSASSTVKMLQLANSQNIPVYRANASNWNAVNGQLVNYPVSVKDSIQSRVNDTVSPALALLPKNGQISNGQWSGFGYATSSANLAEMKISGGYFGGYNSQPGTISVHEIALWILASPLYTAGTTPAASATYTPHTTPLMLSSDPVDMLSGAFVMDKTELTLGNSSGVRSLTFSRHYNSNRRFDKTPGLGYGWTHNYDISLTKRSSVNAGLGGTISYHAVPFYTALQVASDLFRTQTNAKEWLTAALVTNWAVDQLKYNAVSITMGNQTIEFIRLPDGSYEAPAGMNLTLTSHGAGAMEYFSLTERNGPTHTFNTSGQISSITDLWGKAQTFGYTGGELTTVSDGYGRTLTFTRTGGRITSVSDANSRSVGFSYNGDDLTGCTDVEGKTWTYSYDTGHRMITTRNPSNRLIIENTYDAESRVIEQLTFGDADKHYKLAYTGYHNTEENPEGGITQYLYDKRGRSIGTVNAHGNRTEAVYDGHDRMILTITPEGEATGYGYDKDNNLESTVDPTIESAELTYDSLHRILTATDKRGSVTTYDSYNAFHQPLSVIAPLARTSIYTYTATGEIDTMEDAEGNVTDNDYNALGQLTQTKLNGQVIATYTYNAYGDIETSKDGLNRTTTFTYNKRRQLLTTTLPPIPGELPAVIAHSYDNEALRATTEDANGNITSSTYSPTGKPLTQTLPALAAGSNVLTHTYDTRDWALDVSDSLARTTAYTHDAARRLTATSDPLNRITTTEHDANGRPLGTTDPLDRTTAIAYTSRGEPETLTDALLNTTGSLYDANGNHTHRTNRRGKTHVFTFDAANRQTASTTPTGKATITGYFDNDLVESITEPSTQATAFTYDTRLRPLTKADPFGTVTYAYNDADQLTTVTEGVNEITRTYDERGRLKTYTNADGDAIQYRYDANGNLTRLTYPPDTQHPTGKEVTYTYNARNLLESVTDWQSRTTTYTYDRIGRLTGTTRPNGTANIIAYDAANQLTSIRETAGGKLISYLRFDHDDASQITRRFRAPLVNSGWQHPSFAATYDDDNRVATINGQSVTHDDDGNMTYAPIREDSGHLNLTYNSRNQLTVADGLTYIYDAEGNRRTLTDTDGTTRYTIDATIDAASGNLLVKHHPDGSKTFYVHGLGLLYEADETGVTKTHHYDQVGSTIARTDDTGKVIGKAEYSAFGITFWKQGDMETPFLYNGQAGVQTDPNGLLNMRARYYSPYLMRFLNADPIGFSGGSNWFAYADGNPISLNDPFGLCPDQYACIGGYGMGNSGNAAAIAQLTMIGQVAVGFTPAGPVFDVLDFKDNYDQGNRGGMAFAAVAFIPGGDLLKLRKLEAVGTINPSAVRFTQDSIGANFRNGESIDDVARALRESGGSDLAKEFPAIRLVEKDGHLFTLDNRRLAAFSAGGQEIPYRMATPAEIAKEWGAKFTTTAEQGWGQYISVRPPRR